MPGKNFGWIRVHSIQGEQNTQDFGSRNFGDAEIIEQLNSFYSQFNPTKAGQAEQVWKDVKQGLPAATALAEINKALVDKYGCDLSTWKAQSEVAKPGTKICVGFDADHTGAAKTVEVSVCCICICASVCACVRVCVCVCVFV